MIMNSPAAIAPSIVAPHKPVDIHVPHPSSVLRYSATTTTTTTKSPLSFPLNQHHNLMFFSQSSPFLLNSSDESDADEEEEEEEGLSENDDQINASDADDSDTEVDYIYSPFGRPPSRLGHRVSPAAKKQSSKKNKRNKPYISIERLKVDNSFLKNQNTKLLLELEHSRSTIQALRNIVNQKDSALQDIRNENQKAMVKIKILEALILSKHAKDGSIIVRSGSDISGKDNSGGGAVNGSDDVKSTSTWNNKESSPPLKQKQQKQPRQKQTKPPPRSTPDTPQQQPSPRPLPKSPTTIITTTTEDLPSTNLQKSTPPPPSPKRQKHQRRWSIDFGPQNSLATDDGPSEDLDTSMMSSHDHSVSSTSSSTIYASCRRSTSSSRSVPRLIKRKTGDIIQSLSSCRPTSTKNGYDFSPPSTPTLVRDEISDDEDNDQEDEGECEDVDEKSRKQRKLGQRLFNKIFPSSSSSSPSSSSSTAAAARGPLSC